MYIIKYSTDWDYFLKNFNVQEKKFEAIVNALKPGKGKKNPRLSYGYKMINDKKIEDDLEDAMNKMNVTFKTPKTGQEIYYYIRELPENFEYDGGKTNTGLYSLMIKEDANKNTGIVRKNDKGENICLLYKKKIGERSWTKRKKFSTTASIRTT
jgi:hypothetical protein